MNDRYLYRAKRTDNGEWVEGCLLIIDDSEYRIATSCLQGDVKELLNVCAYEADQSTICQCTGLEDKNRKPIWENDIVCTPYVDPIFGDIVNDEILDNYTWKVVFVDGGFCVENEDKIINLRSFTNGNNIKAIGNIFDNPELLEK